MLKPLEQSSSVIMIRFKNVEKSFNIEFIDETIED